MIYNFLNLVSKVSQLSDPIDTPTIILCWYFNPEKPLGHSPPGCSEREAKNQRETGHLKAPCSITLALFRPMDGKFLCQPDIKRRSLSYHRTISLEMSGWYAPMSLFWNRVKIQNFHLTSDSMTLHISPYVKNGGHTRKPAFAVWWYLNPCRAHPSPMTACEQGMPLQGWEHRTVSASTRIAAFTNNRQPGKWRLTLLINLFLLSNPPLISWSHQNPESTQPSVVCCLHSQVFQSIFEQKCNQHLRRLILNKLKCHCRQ